MNRDRWIYGKVYAQRKFSNEDEREAWKRGFWRGILVPLKAMVIQMVVAVIISLAAAIGYGLEPIWLWVVIGTSGTLLLMLPFNLWFMV